MSRSDGGDERESEKRKTEKERKENDKGGERDPPPFLPLEASSPSSLHSLSSGSQTPREHIQPDVLVEPLPSGGLPVDPSQLPPSEAAPSVPSSSFISFASSTSLVPRICSFNVNGLSY